MALSTAAMIGLQLAPSVANFIGNRIGPRETAYQKQMSGLADYFKEQMSTPYLDTIEGRSQMSDIERQERRARNRNENRTARTGSTDEARIAGDQAINETVAGARNRVVGREGRYRQRMLSNFIGASTAAENARMQNEAQFSENLQSITSGLGVAGNVLSQSGLIDNLGGIGGNGNRPSLSDRYGNWQWDRNMGGSVNHNLQNTGGANDLLFGDNGNWA